jgi:hypothetical protein
MAIRAYLAVHREAIVETMCQEMAGAGHFGKNEDISDRAYNERETGAEALSKILI